MVTNERIAITRRMANKAQGAKSFVPSGKVINKLPNSEIPFVPAMMEPTGLHIHTIIRIVTARR
jgi:hypothetical protein